MVETGDTGEAKQSKDSGSIEVDFSGLILSLSSAALHYMGQDASASGGGVEINRKLSKYNIDVIELLFQKTNGNLSPEEKDLINHILPDLKIKYAQVFS